MSCGLAIFVKTPALSPVKTRLWPHLGRANAEALHLASAAAVASVAIMARRRGVLHPYWAVAEAAALDGDAWVDLPRVPQGEGSLGERMARVYEALRQRHRGAILVGADAPQLVTAVLENAAEWLSAPEPRLVLGRAEDGGFWLFGGNMALPDSAWTIPHYSTAATGDQFFAAMQDFGQWLQLETLSDLDHARDLPTVLSQLSQLEQPTAAQRHLQAWLGDLPDVLEVCP